MPRRHAGLDAHDVSAPSSDVQTRHPSLKPRASTSASHIKRATPHMRGLHNFAKTAFRDGSPRTGILGLLPQMCVLSSFKVPLKNYCQKNRFYRRMLIISRVAFVSPPCAPKTATTSSATCSAYASSPSLHSGFLGKYPLAVSSCPVTRRACGLRSAGVFCPANVRTCQTPRRQ